MGLIVKRTVEMGGMLATAALPTSGPGQALANGIGLSLLVYLALGVVVAVAGHGRGLVQMDAGARKGSWGFRVMITPGLVVLWPFVLQRWRMAVAGDLTTPRLFRGYSARGQRVAHGVDILVLAVVVPVIVAAAVVWRPAAELGVGSEVAVEPAALPDVVASEVGVFGDLPIGLIVRRGAGGEQVQLDVGAALGRPTLSLFTAPGVRGDALPDGAQFLGPVWGPGLRTFAPVAGGSLRGATLYLIDLANDREVVATHEIP